MGPVPMGGMFISGTMENYKNLLSGSHFVKRDIVSGSELFVHCSGSISLINSTVKSGSHSIGRNFYKWVVRKTIKLIKWVPFRRARVFKWAPIAALLQWVYFTYEYHGEKWVPFQWEETYKWVLQKIIKTY